MEKTQKNIDDNTQKESTAESLDKRIIVFHNGEEYLCINKDNGVILKGEVLKDNDEHQITNYKPLLKDFFFDLFTQYFENITILSAAGTSMDNGDNKGKDRKELWQECEEKLTEISNKIKKVNLKKQSFWENKNLEDTLSYIETYQKLGIEEVTKELNEVKGIIRNNCDLLLDKTNAPHEEFLRKLTARKINSSRVQLFTTNYDTLWEQAASSAGYIIIDGFSFSHPRKFSGRYFDIDIVNREKTRIKNEDSFIPNVIHLYKLHGSVDWKLSGKDIVQTSEDGGDALMIYPASDKYESSYKQPFFEMMSRFQQSLRRDNVLLLVMGFGFQDMHIQNVIVEAVKQNPSLHLVIFDYNDQKSINIERYRNLFSGVMSKISIIFGTFRELTESLPVNKVYQEANNEKSF
jgi:hypothetical protein